LSAPVSSPDSTRPPAPSPCAQGREGPFWLISRSPLAACPSHVSVTRRRGGWVSLSSPLVRSIVSVQVTVLSFTKLAIDPRSANRNSSGTVCSWPAPPFVKVVVLTACLLHSRKKKTKFVRTPPPGLDTPWTISARGSQYTVASSTFHQTFRGRGPNST
jgi:hypothetical protein